jgi:hypothetical protein
MVTEAILCRGIIMSNFNLRGITPDVMALLKQGAQEQHISINLLILKLIKKGLGYSYEVKKTTYHDLDHLAGTWSAADAKEFQDNTAFFEKIDKDLWS